MSRTNNYYNKKHSDEPRKNNEIRVREVRLIGANGEQVGIVPIQEALNQASLVGLDLVEISPNAKPPVCKIMDYGKYKFEKEKKAKEAKKKQKQIKLKEIKFSPVIGEHDYMFKLKKAIEFLENGDKVLFRLRFRGREILHRDKGYEVFERLKNDLQEYGNVEKLPKMEGRFLTMTFSPLKKK